LAEPPELHDDLRQGQTLPHGPGLAGLLGVVVHDDELPKRGPGDHVVRNREQHALPLPSLALSRLDPAEQCVRRCARDAPGEVRIVYGPAEERPRGQMLPRLPVPTELGRLDDVHSLSPPLSLLWSMSHRCVIRSAYMAATRGRCRAARWRRMMYAVSEIGPMNARPSANKAASILSPRSIFRACGVLGVTR